MASTSRPTWKYDVFLSFRGEDVRSNFVDHLYSALRQKGIFAFKDDVKLQRGESISPALLQAIEESRFAIVVFSANYASSSWCLEELVKALECKSTRGLGVLPVFYRVDPSDLRKQRGSVGEAFDKHEQVFKEKKEKIQSWRNALTEAANISGWDSEKHGPEAKLVRDIVKNILCRLGDYDSSILEDFVGLHPRIAEVKSLLEIGLELDNPRIVGICGMGGIGKTTIVKAVYDQIRLQFDASSYLANVREASKKYGLESLQESLLSDLLLDSDIKIRNLDQGLSMIMNRVRHMRVLIILDDVDQLNQLKALVGKLDFFGLGSRIMITTRDTHLLTIYEVKHVYNVEGLNNEEAFELFCCKAFSKNQPTPDFEHLTKVIVNYARGVPLALSVLGSFLIGRKINEWKSAINRLRKRPNAEIQEVLKLSYDGLGHEEKEIFLHIACFFTGESKDYIVDILDTWGFYTHIGISTIVDKSLVTIENNQIDMHDLIQEMGWHIVNEESPKEPGRRSRLWNMEDIYHTLTKCTGTEAVEAIILDSHESKAMTLSPNAFSNMSKLRLLRLRNVQLPNGLNYLPNDLIVLDWQGYPLKYMPSNFQPDRLVELKMSYSCVQQPWRGMTYLDKLKYVDLSYSLCITKLPGFTQVPNLEKLILEGCSNLVEIDPSIGAIKRLTFLNLKYCKYLQVLPTGYWFKSLERLVLSGCSKLKNVYEVLADTKSLIKLYLDETCIKELPVEHLSNLELITLRDCKELKSLRNGICGLKLLKKLILSGCLNLNNLPENFGELENLKELRVDLTAIKQLPSSSILLKNLKRLSFSGYKGGESSSLQTSPFLSFIFPKKCQDPMSLVLPPLSSFCLLYELDLTDCNLSEGFLPNDLGSLSSLRFLYLAGNNFVSLPASIRGLSSLYCLDLMDCEKLKALPELPPKISLVNASGCMALEGLPDLSTVCSKLREFYLSDCQTRFKGFLAAAGHNLYEKDYRRREIPKWVNHQNSKGQYVRIQLVPDWNVKCNAFLLCVVFAAKAATDARVYMECYWMSDDVPVYSSCEVIRNFRQKSVFQSGHHLIMHYVPLWEWFGGGKPREEYGNSLKISEIICYFSSSRPEMFAAVKCGGHVLCRKDVEWNNPTATTSTIQQQRDSHLSDASIQVIRNSYNFLSRITGNTIQRGSVIKR